MIKSVDGRCKSWTAKRLKNDSAETIRGSTEFAFFPANHENGQFTDLPDKPLVASDRLSIFNRFYVHMYVLKSSLQKIFFCQKVKFRKTLDFLDTNPTL
jgi:hypothetical protein